MHARRVAGHRATLPLSGLHVATHHSARYPGISRTHSRRITPKLKQKPHTHNVNLVFLWVWGVCWGLWGAGAFLSCDKVCVVVSALPSQGVTRVVKYSSRFKSAAGSGMEIGGRLAAHAGLGVLGEFCDAVGLGEALPEQLSYRGPGMAVFDRGAVLAQMMPDGRWRRRGVQRYQGAAL